ncbi:hypothetical protein [Pseudaestuariivita atlantica]|uniref:Uncharacterized protein n=1 Tax=Pseudaestuariivita atlantica TaxID=1317121 RepID=A0A0L1JLL6_9RHOB|nr:hypothetical protein [Pseudaestuariivita atlantica]KNG92641.1 hypothetical protein ATO11_16625 [Pseudaestuariivita atlantica]
MHRLHILLLAASLLAGPVAAQQSAASNNLWLMWEQIPATDPLCIGAEECAPKRRLRSHFMMNVPTPDAASLFERLEPSARYFGSANLEHEALPICLDGPDEPGVIPDYTTMEYAEKIDTLRGLTGVFADLRGARGPATFKGNFGGEAHTFLVEAMAQAGIPMVAKDDLDQVPGRPTLSLRYSPEVYGCRPWSVSLSLKQDMALTRDLTLMLSGTTWSAFAGQSEADADFSPRDAMQTVITAFIDAWQKANRIEPPAATDEAQVTPAAADGG